MEKLRWTAASNKTWIKISTGGTAAQQIAGEGTTDVTITVTSAESASETDTEGTVTFRSAGLDDIVVNVTRCKPDCKYEDTPQITYYPVELTVGPCETSTIIDVPYTKTYVSKTAGCPNKTQEGSNHYELEFDVNPTEDPLVADELYDNGQLVYRITQEAGPCCKCEDLLYHLVNQVNLNVGDSEEIECDADCYTFVTATTNKSNIATASVVNGKKIKITGIGSGDAEISVSYETTTDVCFDPFIVYVHVDETIKEYDINVVSETPSPMTCQGGTVTFEAVPKNN